MKRIPTRSFNYCSIFPHLPSNQPATNRQPQRFITQCHFHAFIFTRFHAQPDPEASTQPHATSPGQPAAARQSMHRLLHPSSNNPLPAKRHLTRSASCSIVGTTLVDRPTAVLPGTAMLGFDCSVVCSCHRAYAMPAVPARECRRPRHIALSEPTQMSVFISLDTTTTCSS